MTAATALLGYVIAERLIELVIARRNTHALLATGAHEVGAAHYPLIVGIHVLWIVSLVWWAARGAVLLAPGWAAVYLALQPLRFWTMLSLGRYWTTRIIVVPDAPLIARGPYRFLKHPNYVVVVAEIAALPLALGAWQLAALFTALNAAVLAVRIRTETATLRVRALGSRSAS